MRTIIAIICASLGGFAAIAAETGDAAKALEQAEKAVAAHPNDAQSLFTRGVILSALHRPADAAADFDRVLQLDPKKVEAYDRRGSEEFKLSRFADSVADFDRYLEARPDERPGHWRRGISLYYAGKYDEGRKQFAGYEQVDTNDVENAVWHFLSAARADGVQKARSSMLKVGKDSRVPLMKVYDLFHGDAQPEDVLTAARAGDPSKAELNSRLFYAHLYLGLYFDATGDKKQALEQMTLAAHKNTISEYMGDVARVHETAYCSRIRADEMTPAVTSLKRKRRDLGRRPSLAASGLCGPYKPEAQAKDIGEAFACASGLYRFYRFSQSGRQLLRLVHHLPQQPQAQFPETRVPHVNAQPCQQRVRRRRSAGRQEFKVLRHERRTLLTIFLHQRQHQQFAKGVSVAIKGRPDVMADVRPPPAVAVAPAAPRRHTSADSLPSTVR